VSIPFGAPVNGSTFDTEYRTVSDLTKMRYYFESTTAPNVNWIDLKKVNLEAGAPVMALDPKAADFSGEVGASFKGTDAPF
jgi:penicillin V acylase-like amidase (Ntn superfamily)